MEPECTFCGEPVGHPPYFEVTGWERHREQGGTNALRLREQTGRVACSACIAKKSLGVSEDQETLL